MDAAIAAPPRHECRPTVFPGSHPCPGPTDIFASATEGHGASLRPRLAHAGPSQCKSASARLHPASSGGLAGFYASRSERGQAERLLATLRPCSPLGITPAPVLRTCEMGSPDLPLRVVAMGKGFRLFSPF